MFNFFPARVANKYAVETCLSNMLAECNDADIAFLEAITQSIKKQVKDGKGSYTVYYSVETPYPSKSVIRDIAHRTHLITKFFGTLGYNISPKSKYEDTDIITKVVITWGTRMW